MQFLRFKSLHDFNCFFKDEKTCYKYLEDFRWGNEITCSHCENDTYYTVKSRGNFKDVPSYRCTNCDLPFTVRTGTIFQGSKVEMKKWFHAIYELMTCKKGISSVQLAERIGVSQKTAWLMNHKIREALKNEHVDFSNAVVELDETFVGGKNKNRHWDKKVEHSQGRSYKDKTPVLGILKEQTEIPTVSLSKKKL